MDTLLKAGDFAKLCRTTKETLRHYDRIGLLRPAARADNGYKLYALSQIVDFALVSALRSTGLALSEVRAFLEDPGSERLQQTIGERVAEIERQQRDLEAKRQVLVETMEQARRLAEWLDDENSGDDAPRTAEGYRWRIRFCEEERFIEGAIPYKEGCEDDFLAAAVDHLDYCERQGVGATFQEAYRVDAAHVAEGDYAAGLCAEARVPAGAPPSDRLRVKPAGTYLQLLNRIDLSPIMQAADGGADAAPSGEPNPLFAAYDALRALAREKGWRLSGDLYDVVLSTYAGRATDALYTEASMMVEVEPAAGD